jgi:hypothetical protein
MESVSERFCDIPTPTPLPASGDGLSGMRSVKGRETGRVFHCRELLQGFENDKEDKDSTVLSFSCPSERGIGPDQSRIRTNIMRARTRSKTEAVQAIKTAATLGNLATTRTVIMKRSKVGLCMEKRYKVFKYNGDDVQHWQRCG